MVNKWIVLLTSSIVPNEATDRRTLYRTQILKWLQHTNLHIFIVENTGWKFPFIVHPRFHVISYVNNIPFNSSSKFEAHAILHAMEKLPMYQQFNDCTHILKVTGRYYFHGIENVLNNTGDNADLYLQTHRNPMDKWQHSEYYGIKKELMCEFINSVQNKLMEQALYEFSEFKQFHHIGPFENNIPRGGDKMIMHLI